MKKAVNIASNPTTIISAEFFLIPFLSTIATVIMNVPYLYFRTLLSV